MEHWQMMKIGITGVGGPAGVVTAKALFETKKFHLIGMDANPLSAGFKFTHKRYIIPFARDSSFIKRIMDISLKEKIDLIIPTVDEELLPLSTENEKFDQIGVKIAVSSPETLINCLDKYNLYKKLQEFYIPSPTTYLLKDAMVETINFPVIVKPRMGRGSRDIIVCQNYKELKFILNTKRDGENLIVQEYLEGSEFTVDTLSDLCGKGIVAVPRKRIETKGGVSWRGAVVKNEQLAKVAIKAVQTLGIIGPSCVQLKLSNNVTPKVIEVNPRIGGTTSLTVKAGVNIPLLTVKTFLGEKIKRDEVSYRPILLARYFEDVYFNPEDFSILK
jgi:carbamoyl-phosphate synthase large subunit